MTGTRLGRLVAPHLGSALLAFDVDGVLAPIVAHADRAEVSAEVHTSLERLGERTEVAIVSGRSVADLERLFGFGPDLHVVGSHGLEQRGDGPVELDDSERHTLEQLEILGTRTVDAAGRGAWLEHKPASVVVHTRQAEPALAHAAVTALTRLAALVPGAHLKPGHCVVELLVRHGSKGRALMSLADRLGRSPIVFVGDDLTDEEAFAMMGVDDIAVRVGPGASTARYRLRGPGDVAEFLDHLATAT